MTQRRPIGRTATEVAARRRLGTALKPALVALDWYDRALMTFARDIEAAPDAAAWRSVQSQLAARVADELRVMRLAAASGYLLPTMTLGASAFEISYTMAYISADGTRAERWRAHTRLEGTPWPVRKIVSEVTAASGNVALAANAYGHYQMLCTGKHHNPVLAGSVPFATSGEAHLVEIDPVISPGRRRNLAIVATFTLLHVAECLDRLAGSGVLTSEAASTLNQGRLKWNAVASTCTRKS